MSYKKSVNGLFLTSSHLMLKKQILVFHKPSKKYDIPLALPKLNINNREIAPTESIKFLGVLLDDNLSWKTHVKYIENKISKNIGILLKARPFLNKKSLLSVYCWCIPSYTNYGTVSWWSTCRTNLKKYIVSKSMFFASFLIKVNFSIPVNCLKLEKI